jgi:hypothetical protein
MIPTRLDDPNFRVELRAAWFVNGDFRHVAGNKRNADWRADQRLRGSSEDMLRGGVGEQYDSKFVNHNDPISIFLNEESDLCMIDIGSG